MATLTTVSDRIKAKKALYQQKADEWATRLDNLDKLEPDAFAATDAAIAASEQDLISMESDLRMLSNAAPVKPSPLPPPPLDLSTANALPNAQVSVRPGSATDSAPGATQG